MLVDPSPRMDKYDRMRGDHDVGWKKSSFDETRSVLLPALSRSHVPSSLFLCSSLCLNFLFFFRSARSMPFLPPPFLPPPFLPPPSRAASIVFQKIHTFDSYVVCAIAEVLLCNVQSLQVVLRLPRQSLRFYDFREFVDGTYVPI